MNAIESQIVIGIVILIIGVVINLFLKTNDKKDERLDKLWEVHHEKIKDSDKIALQEARINAIEKKHDYLEQKQNYHYHKIEVDYQKIEVDIKELKLLVTHKNNGEGQGFNNIANIIKEEMQKLKAEIIKAK